MFCSVVKTIHVYKADRDQRFCHAHFASEADAAAFFFYYRIKNKLLCSSLQGCLVILNRNLSIVQRHLDDHRTPWCKCSVFPPPPSLLKRAIEELEEEIYRDEASLAVKRRKLALLVEAHSI
ncbi:hypothetical protein RMATCC62417_13943 [Rhizopus microsporus]|nr:hypothetical protein RMATCC62417_13943 [Rhizopus microsporus]